MVRQCVAVVVVASPEVRREEEVVSVRVDVAAPVASPVVEAAAFREEHREDVGSAGEEVRAGKSQNGESGVLVTCLFQVFCV